MGNYYKIIIKLQSISLACNTINTLYINNIGSHTTTAHHYNSSNKLSNNKNKYNACIYRKSIFSHR